MIILLIDIDEGFIRKFISVLIFLIEHCPPMPTISRPWDHEPIIENSGSQGFEEPVDLLFSASVLGFLLSSIKVLIFKKLASI